MDKQLLSKHCGCEEGKGEGEKGGELVTHTKVKGGNQGNGRRKRAKKEQNRNIEEQQQDLTKTTAIKK